MKSIAFVAAVAVLVVGGGAARAAVKPAHDVGIRMKLKDSRTFGPLATVTVRNEGTAAQTGVVVAVRAENESGPVLWTTTVDLLPRKSAKLAARVFLDEGPFVLVATAALSGATDEDPADNAARAGLWLKGKGATMLVGRELYATNCESCHGAGATGGTGPALVGIKAKVLLAKTRTGGDHDFPWFGKSDSSALGTYLKAPSALVEPSIPSPPVGGWPTFAGDAKPIFDARCVACHSGYGVYDKAYASASRGLSAIKKGSMPRSGGPMTAEQVQILTDWITGGRRP